MQKKYKDNHLIGQVMKITGLYLLFAMLLCSVTFANDNYGQTVLEKKVSLQLQDVTFKMALSRIEALSGVKFVYSKSRVSLNEKVSLNFTQQKLATVLDDLLLTRFIHYEVQNDRYVILIPEDKETHNGYFTPVLHNDKVVAAQPSVIKIHGQVVSAQDKTPLPGVVVRAKSSGKGVVTDANGEFEIETEDDGTLIFSFLGFITEEVTINKQTSVNVSLVADIKSLNDVVVTGYQVINKESYTGTAITVTGDELKTINPQNLLQSIQSFDPSFNVVQNNLSGSDPNKLPSINVRGSTALPSGSGALIDRNELAGNVNLPTFILDGYEVSLEKVYDLDVNRIETVTLLKDAAATAVYGSRAANGVLVITSKSPKEGKLQLYYNYDLTVTGPDLTNYKVLNATEKLEYERLAGLYTANGAQSQDDLDVIYYNKKRNVVSGVNTYWLSQPLTTTFGNKHSLSLEGGSSSIRYGVDLRYQTSPGVMKGSSRNRYGFAVNLSYNPGKTFIFKNALSIDQVKSKESPYGSFSDYVKMNPYYPKTDSLGHIQQKIDSWVNRNTSDASLQTEIVLNPLYESTLSSFKKTSYLEFTDAFSAEWNIVSGLRLRALASLTKRKTDYDDFVSPLSNQFYYYTTDKLSTRGKYTYESGDETTLDGNITLTFNKQLRNHFFNVALGANVRTNTSDSKSFTVVGFTNDRFTNIDFASGYDKNSTPSGSYTQERLAGSFLTLNYSLKNKYLLDFTGRADGSSKFGTENKVAPFWAAGIGWNIHKEDWLDRTFISQLKVRASTGMTGSVSFPAYMSKTMYTYYGSSWYSTGVGAVVNNYGNESLKWQKTRNYDLGLDLGLFNDRIVISPRYYYKLTSGLISDIVLPPSTGFSSYTDNLGDMENRGYELNLKYALVKNKTWLVNLTASLVSNTNKIVKISNALTEYNKKADDAQVTDEYKSTPLLRFKEGESLNTIYTVRSLGIDPENGKELFLKKDGVTTTYDWSVKDIVAVGDETPKAEGFWGTSITFKGLMLSASFYYHFGGQTYNQTLVDRVENADPRYNVDRRVLEQRWKKPGDHVFFKNIADQGTTFTSSRFVQHDNIMELRSLYLSYDFNKSVYSRVKMKNLRLAFTMNDVWRWSSIDIERGIDYPFARSFNFSLQTSF
jgi:TonB-linked SusC/RagA family outer membrane protein